VIMVINASQRTNHMVRLVQDVFKIIAEYQEKYSKNGLNS